MTTPITTAKQQLRAVMKQRLSNVSHDSILSQSRTIFELLKNFKPYREATRISIFLSMPSGEIQTDAIVRHALHEGKHVFVPYLYKPPVQTPNAPKRVMDMVRLNSIQDYDALERDSWDIPSIDPDTVHERQRIFGKSESHQQDAALLDLILVPGVAFDVDDSGSIRRLGHGKGFYDFFLNRYLATGSRASDVHQLKFFGLALKEQLLGAQSDEEIPMGAYDRKLHGVILGDGRIKESPDHWCISSWRPS